jgi:hypothetical protein
MEPVGLNTQVSTRRFEDIPLNCPESRRRRIFVCEKRCKVLHYMAQSYATYIDAYIGYYGGFWQVFGQMSWTVINFSSAFQRSKVEY